MAVEATNPYSTFTGNGMTVSFPFSFACRNVADLAVYVGGALQASGYSVTLDSDFNGGTVLFTTAPANLAAIIVASQPSFEQQIAFENAGPYNPSTVDGVADAGAIRDIYLAGLVARAPLAPIGETLGPLPAKVSRLGQFFAFDADGNPVAASGTGADAGLRSDLAAGTGATLLGWLPSITGAVLRTISSWFGDFAYPAAMFGAAGDGVTDDTAALQKPLTLGLKCRLKNSATYLITSGLDHGTGGGFVCPDGTATIKAKTGAGGFNVTSSAAPRTGLDRNMLRCNGTDNLTLRNVIFTTDGATEVYLNGLRFVGGMGTIGYDVRGIAFSKFFNGAMVAVASVGAGKNRLIDIAYAVDSGVTQGSAYFTAGPAQTTVVEIDNDILTATPSVGGIVRIGLIKNVLFTGQALTDFGQETDGVNIICQGANSTSGWTISIDRIDGVGEPVDIQGWKNNVTIGYIRNAYNDAIKLIHGAQNNNIYVGVIEASGGSAVYISGSDSAVCDRDTKGNNIHVGTVINPGSYGLGPAAGFAVLFADANSAHKPVQNTVTIDNIVGDGVNLDYVVSDGGTDTGNDNLVIIGKASGFVVASVMAPPSNVRVKYLGRCFAELTMSTTPSLTTATATKLPFDTVVNDPEAIAVTASNKLTIKWPGVYRVIASARMDGWAVGASDRWQMEIRQNVTTVRVNSGKINFGAGKDEKAFVNELIYIDENDVGTSGADLTAWLTQDTGASKVVSNTATYTRFSAERVG